MTHNTLPRTGIDLQQPNAEKVAEYAARFSVGPELAEKIAAFDSESGGGGLHAGGIGFGEAPDKLGSASGMTSDTREAYEAIERAAFSGGPRTKEEELTLAIHSAGVGAELGASEYKLVCPPSERVTPSDGGDGTSLGIGRGYYLNWAGRVGVVESVVKRGPDVQDAQGNYTPGEVLDYVVGTRMASREESDAVRRDIYDATGR